MVEVRVHVLGVKVHGCLYGFLGVCVVVNEDDDHNVVPNVTFPLELCRVNCTVIRIISKMISCNVEIKDYLYSFIGNCIESRTMVLNEGMLYSWDTVAQTVAVLAGCV